MLELVENYIARFSSAVPVEVFVFLGSFVEDILAPIPSPLVTTMAGTIAQASGYGWSGLVVLALLAAAGKTCGAVLFYILADKAEDLLMVRIGPKIGVSHQDLEGVGRYFTGSSKDYAMIILARAAPFIPSMPISVVAGILKVPMRLFIITTFVGTFIRGGIFLVIGFIGLEEFGNMMAWLESLESLTQVAIGLTVLAILLWLAYSRLLKRKQRRERIK